MIPRCDAPRILFFLLVFTSIGTICFAEQSESSDHESSNTPDMFLFFEGAVHFGYLPMFFNPVQPTLGFHGALGFELRQLRFSLASGYTFITGTNPYVRDLAFIPLTFRLGYELSLGETYGISIRADLGGGFRFTEVNKYEIEYGSKDKMTYETGISPTVEGRLSVAFTLPESPLQIYAGGGTLLLFETKGPVFHPALETGLVFKIPIPTKGPGGSEEPGVTKVRIPHPDALPDAQTDMNFFEVALRNRNTDTVTSVYASLFKGDIGVEIPPGTYDILLFAGNKHSPACTPLLLATSHAQNVNIVEGQTTEVSMPTLIPFAVVLTDILPKVEVNKAFPAGFTVKPGNPLIAPTGIFPHRDLRINIDGVTSDLAETGWEPNGEPETYTYTGSATISSPTGGAKSVVGFTGNIRMFDGTPESKTLVWAYTDFEHPILGGNYKREVIVEEEEIIVEEEIVEEPVVSRRDNTIIDDRQ